MPSTMYADLPLELLVLILQNLPTKSLLRFRCVSKSWYSLISSPSFISLHHQHSLRTRQTNGSDLLLLRHYSLTHKKERNTLFLDCHHGHGESFIEQCDLDFPLKTCDSYFYVGSCNGLICFSNLIVRKLKIVIWNPSARKCLELPVPRFVATDFMQINVVGFGLDFKTDTYKVLRLVYSIRNNSLREAPSQVEIYDVTTNVWRTIQMEVPYIVIEASAEVYMNGAIHWIGYKAVVDETPFPRLLVVLFDLENEEFREISIPDDVAHTPSVGLTLASFGETICLIHYQPAIERREESRHCCIWVLTKYGHENSWLKLFTFDMKGNGGSKRVLGLRKKGHLLLVNSSDELVSYEIGSQHITHLRLYGVERSFEIIPYSESLVLLKDKGELS